MEKRFKLCSKYSPAGDQPKAIKQLTEGILNGDDAQTLLGITGSGKTYTIANVIEQIHQNYAKNLMLKDIADEFNYSLPYLSKLFKDKTMLTFQLYLQKTRINEACRLLANTDEKVQTIAKMVGYSDIIFFSKLFKKYNGVTPKQFRQQMKKTNELKE